MLTNELYLPQALVSLVEKNQRKPKKNRFGITQLINPPLIRTLEMEHWESLTSDVSDYLWMILGQSVDYILSECAKNKNSLVQHKMVHKMKCHNGRMVEVVGVPDLIVDDNIEDWKVTSVWSFVKGIKPEWVAQLNMYDLLRHFEREKDPTVPEVNFLVINAILRDWNRSGLKDDDYPKQNFIRKYVPKWSRKEQIDYLNERLYLHIDHSKDECSPAGKWQRPTVYALSRKGGKRAIKLFDKEEDAAIWGINKYRKEWDKGTVTINMRLGANVRCEGFCKVRSVCPYVGKEK